MRFDLHTVVAATNLSIAQSTVTKEQRQKFKQRNFMHLYSANNLSPLDLLPSGIAILAFEGIVIEDIQYTRRDHNDENAIA